MPVRVELPSGAWVEVREQLTLADRWATSEGLEIQSRDGIQYIPASFGDQQMRNFLTSVITAWSFEGIPVPSQNIGGSAVLGTVFTNLDDYDALEDAVQPLYQKVSRNRPNRKVGGTTPSSSSSPS